MEEHPIAINIQNLSKRYGSKADQPPVLNDISFQVPLGKICCLLGPNGSGKTTLLKILAGLIQPTTGSLTIHGINPHADPRIARSNIGWMPAEERSGFYGRLTGRQNLMFFGSLQGVTGKNLERMIGNISLQIGLNDDIDKPIQKISSGAKQKIALARVLLHNPPILLLDEPTRNLDPHTALRFRRLLRDHLARIQNKTILLSTHQLEEAQRVADQIIILKEGRIIRTIDSLALEKEMKKSTLEKFYFDTLEEVEAE